MKETFLYALPGFLGKPKDWECLFQPAEMQAIDIFSFPIKNFWEWAKWFNEKVEEETHTHPKPYRIIMGYSLGGRLAMHVALQNPNLWDAVIIISAHPGLKKATEREQRLINDQRWAQRFEVDPWDQLMKDWNAQPIFQKDTWNFNRQEKDYSRSALAESLRQWSLGNQEDLESKLNDLNLPIFWITGADDFLYSSLANQMMLKHSFSKIINIPQAGHRAPWQKPKTFLEELNQFLERKIYGNIDLSLGAHQGI